MSTPLKFMKPKPPINGSFPLDRDRVCIDEVEAYQQCLRNQEGNTAMCRQLAKEYLLCRMDNGLMAEIPLESLGYNGREAIEEEFPIEVQENSREAKGFVPGKDIVRRGIWESIFGEEREVGGGMSVGEKK